MMCFVGKNLINDFIKKNLIDLKKYGSPDLVSFFQNMADCVNFKKIVAD